MRCALRITRQLEPVLEQVLAEKTVDEWCSILAEAGVPSGPLCDVGQVFGDEQVAARNMIVELEHPVAGRQTVANSPLRFSATPVELRGPAPLLGQHTEEVLSGVLGLTEGEMEALRAEGVI